MLAVRLGVPSILPEGNMKYLALQTEKWPLRMANMSDGVKRPWNTLRIVAQDPSLRAKQFEQV